MTAPVRPLTPRTFTRASVETALEMHRNGRRLVAWERAGPGRWEVTLNTLAPTRSVLSLTSMREAQVFLAALASAVNAPKPARS